MIAAALLLSSLPVAPAASGANLTGTFVTPGPWDVLAKDGEVALDVSGYAQQATGVAGVVRIDDVEVAHFLRPLGPNAQENGTVVRVRIDATALPSGNATLTATVWTDLDPPASVGPRRVVLDARPTIQILQADYVVALRAYVVAAQVRDPEGGPVHAVALTPAGSVVMAQEGDVRRATVRGNWTPPQASGAVAAVDIANLTRWESVPFRLVNHPPDLWNVTASYRIGGTFLVQGHLDDLDDGVREAWIESDIGPRVPIAVNGTTFNVSYPVFAPPGSYAGKVVALDGHGGRAEHPLALQVVGVARVVHERTVGGAVGVHESVDRFVLPRLVDATVSICPSERCLDPGAGAGDWTGTIAFGWTEETQRSASLQCAAHQSLATRWTHGCGAFANDRPRSGFVHWNVAFHTPTEIRVVVRGIEY